MEGIADTVVGTGAVEALAMNERQSPSQSGANTHVAQGYPCAWTHSNTEANREDRIGGKTCAV